MSEQLMLPGLKRMPANGFEFRQMLEVADMNSGSFQLEVFYRMAFPHLKEIEKVNDLGMQRQGIDTIITVTGGKRYFFDEKIRKKDYGDILLEEWSIWRNYPYVNGHKVDCHESVRNGSGFGLIPGWISGKKQTDYIAYIIKPSRKVYFLPYLLLQRAWLMSYLKWIREYGRLPTSTVDEEDHILYYTTNLPIPVEVLFNAMYREVRGSNEHQGNDERVGEIEPQRYATTSTFGLS